MRSWRCRACFRARRGQQVLERDARADGQFFYAVKSTKVYCRPSCPSRRPTRKNVTFFPTTEAARSAGYRACLRCEPDGVTAQGRSAGGRDRCCYRVPGAAPGREDAAEGSRQGHGRGQVHDPARVQTRLGRFARRVRPGAARIAAFKGQGARAKGACDRCNLRCGVRVQAAVCTKARTKRWG